MQNILYVLYANVFIGFMMFASVDITIVGVIKQNYVSKTICIVVLILKCSLIDSGTILLKILRINLINLNFTTKRHKVNKLLILVDITLLDIPYDPSHGS